MRVLHLLASPFWSGPAENVAQLALAQRRLGHEVRVAVDRLRLEVPAEEPSAPRFQALELLDEGGLELSVKSSPARMWLDLRAIRRRTVDVVHAHFSHDHLLARWGRPPGATLVRSIHAPRSLRRTLPFADAFTVPSAGLLRPLLGRRVMVLPPLVGPEFVPAADRLAARKSLGISGDPVIGMVSTFQPSRRHALGLEAFARLRNERPAARLVLVGDGAERARIEARVRELGLGSAVAFAGYQSGPAFVRWLQALDSVWILGLGNDWSGRAAAQARACGVRTIGVDEGALADHADALVAADERALAAASLADERRCDAPRSPDDIAREVLRLYAR
jgi:glycosyltransferase involved in cell wall biosynthesis